MMEKGKGNIEKLQAIQKAISEEAAAKKASRPKVEYTRDGYPIAQVKIQQVQKKVDETTALLTKKIETDIQKTYQSTESLDELQKQSDSLKEKQDVFKKTPHKNKSSRGCWAALFCCYPGFSKSDTDEDLYMKEYSKHGYTPIK